MKKNAKSIFNDLTRYAYCPGTQNEEGWAIAETMIAVVIGLIMLGGVFALVNIALSNSKVQNAEQNIATIRSGVQQLYSTSRDYSGLSNVIAQQAGLVPADLLTNTMGTFSNGWNGSVVILPNVIPTLFDITYNSIPEKEAMKLATYGVGSWHGVTLNGTAISQLGGTAVADAGANVVPGPNNIIVYTSN